MKRPFFLLPLLSLTLACSAPHKSQVSNPGNSIAIDGKIWSSLFQQRAAEYKALCLQAYAIAGLRLEQSLAIPSPKPRAIITDIDETFLDNSPYAVKRAMAGRDYDAASWEDWTSKGSADTLSGALSFFNYAASTNTTIFYLTNREEKERAGTLQNLQRFHFPFADNAHLIMRQGPSSKEARRQQVAENYTIVLLLGDNLADFSALFDKKTEAQRNEAVSQLAADFGKRFIVLPNFNYGGWEEALYNNSYKWRERDSIIRARVKSY